jgi:hypothetical protein
LLLSLVFSTVLETQAPSESAIRFLTKDPAVKRLRCLFFARQPLRGFQPES